MTPESIRAIHDLPFPELIFRAASVHRERWNPVKLQLCTLDSLKTGACSEDCAYCAQSAHHQTALKPDPLKNRERVIQGAQWAKKLGSTRYCMATSGRVLEEGPEFDAVLEVIRAVSEMGMEPCVSLGLINERQAIRLKESGCHIYNHNLDTSREMYGRIVSTHSYDERIATIRAVRAAGLNVCCGGILGLGESVSDRVDFLHELTQLNPAPEAIPINILVPIEGTPLEKQTPVSPIEVIRVIATARIVCPESRIRLAAGRQSLSVEAQALAFMAGANSIFAGEKLLTTPGAAPGSDAWMMEMLGMQPESF